MSDKRPLPSLEDLAARLRKAEDGRAAGGATRQSRDDEPQGAFGMAIRVGIELATAVGVGVGSGIVIDRWLGTAPFGLVVMLFLGSAAGFVNVYRAANGIGSAIGYRRPDDEGKRRNGVNGH
jgi:ATP synthase protein I